MSRQNYYKERKRRKVWSIDEGLVVSLVKQERQLQPRLGVRKLHFILRPELEEAGVKVGRDRMFDILRAWGLLVPPLPKAPRTTNSSHVLPVFQNMIRDMEPERPNEVWVADLTYLRTQEGYAYLSVIMDLYSRKIVGYHCGDSLEASECTLALEDALRDLPRGCAPTHHSDRGCQYCSHKYVNRLLSDGLTVSMTEENHCYENAYAERVIGILKQEYGLGKVFMTRKQVSGAVSQAVWLYNTRRPHMSLGYRMPEEVHNAAA